MLSPKLKRICTLLAILVFVLLVAHLLVPNRSHPYLYRDRFITVYNNDDRTNQNGHDDLHKLLDLQAFNYTLKPTQSACTPESSDQLLAILTITSYAGHDELRSAHRRAMPASLLRSMGLRRIFLVAALPPSERFITQEALVAEHLRFDDLLQGNFQEAYRNLSYKHTMGLRWASASCDRQTDGDLAKFIVKADDDTVFDLYYLHGHLLDLVDTDHLGSNEFLAGFVLDGKRPIRNVANKWYVSADEYAAEVYPDYLSGWLYLTTPATAHRLVQRAQRDGAIGFLWIDDLWVTGVLRAPLGIPLVPLNRWFSANAEFLDCCIADLRRWSVRCQYQVGPNGGDSRLIVEFAQALQRCYVDTSNDGDGDDGGGNWCAERSPAQSLARTCVARSKHLVAEHGQPVVAAMRL